jgi:hypothetical protein
MGDIFLLGFLVFPKSACRLDRRDQPILNQMEMQPNMTKPALKLYIGHRSQGTIKQRTWIKIVSTKNSTARTFTPATLLPIIQVESIACSFHLII